jgi:hypothetical protein
MSQKITYKWPIDDFFVVSKLDGAKNDVPNRLIRNKGNASSAASKNVGSSRKVGSSSWDYFMLEGPEFKLGSLQLRLDLQSYYLSTDCSKIYSDIFLGIQDFGGESEIKLTYKLWMENNCGEVTYKRGKLNLLEYNAWVFCFVVRIKMSNLVNSL